MAPFPVEKAPTERIIRRGKLPNSGVMISKMLNYPVQGFVFEGGNLMQDLSDTVANSCIFLQNNNIPYNVLISDCGGRIFLFPQVFFFSFFSTYQRFELFIGGLFSYAFYPTQFWSSWP